MTWSKRRGLGLAVLIVLIVTIASVYYLQQATGPQVDGAGIYATGSGTSLTGNITHVAKVVIVIFVWSSTGTNVSSLTVGGHAATLQTGLGISIGGISCWAIAVTWGAATDTVTVTFTNSTTSALVGLSIKNTVSQATEGPQSAIGHDSISASANVTIPAGTANRLILQCGIGSGSGSVSVPVANGVVSRVTVEDASTSPQVFMYAGTADDGTSNTYTNTVTASGPGPAFVGSMVLAVDP